MNCNNADVALLLDVENDLMEEFNHAHPCRRCR